MVSLSAVAAQAEAIHAAAWNPKSAAEYLDDRTASWAHNMGAIDRGTFCISCHSVLPYALARSALRTDRGEREPSPVEREMLDSVTRRVRLWKEVRPFLSGPTESRGTESVLNALVLVSYDAPKHMLGDDTRQALDILWDRQLKTGAAAGSWPWFSLGNEPWEAPDSQYWGATLAAVAVGSTPKNYQTAPNIQEGLKLLKEYLRQGERGQSLHNRLSLLWAATRLQGLLTPDERQAIVKEALARQHPDGGWSASDLVLSTWARHDGTPQTTASDGYATGFTAFVIEQARVPGSRRAIEAARSWLIQSQDQNGGFWPGASWNKQRDPNTDVGRFMTDAATAFSVLALADLHRSQ